MLFAPALVLAWPHPSQLALALSFVAFTIAVLGLPVVLSVTGEGLVWSGFSKLPWSQIKSVRRVSLLGLPYLIVSRTRGFRWWLPLYVRGPVSFESAVAKLAPHENPLYAYVSIGSGAQRPSSPAVSLSYSEFAAEQEGIWIMQSFGHFRD